VLPTNLGAVQTFVFRLHRREASDLGRWVPFNLGVGGSAKFVIVNPDTGADVLAATMTVIQDDAEATLVGYQLNVDAVGLTQRRYRAAVRATAADGEKMKLPLGNEWFQLEVGPR
jgi:hypothetical protein